MQSEIEIFQRSEMRHLSAITAVLDATGWHARIQRQNAIDELAAGNKSGAALPANSTSRFPRLPLNPKSLALAA